MFVVLPHRPLWSSARRLASGLGQLQVLSARGIASWSALWVSELLGACSSCFLEVLLGGVLVASLLEGACLPTLGAYALLLPLHQRWIPGPVLGFPSSGADVREVLVVLPHGSFVPLQ